MVIIQVVMIIMMCNGCSCCDVIMFFLCLAKIMISEMCARKNCESDDRREKRFGTSLVFMLNIFSFILTSPVQKYYRPEEGYPLVVRLRPTGGWAFPAFYHFGQESI